MKREGRSLQADPSAGLQRSRRRPALPDEYEWVWTPEVINVGLGICGLARNVMARLFPPALRLSHTLTLQDLGLLFLFPPLLHLPEQRCIDSGPEIEFVSRLFGERARRFHSEQLQCSGMAHKQASVFALWMADALILIKVTPMHIHWWHTSSFLPSWHLLNVGMCRFITEFLIYAGCAHDTGLLFKKKKMSKCLTMYNKGHRTAEIRRLNHITCDVCRFIAIQSHWATRSGFLLHKCRWFWVMAQAVHERMRSCDQSALYIFKYMF